MQVNLKDFEEKLKELSQDMKKYPDGRHRSWEICYKEFSEAKKRSEKSKISDSDVDYLSLHLAFYLASWGMYRGSSFLLQWDYTVHREVVCALLNEKYSNLYALECAKLEKNWDLINELYNEIKTIYHEARSKVKEVESEVSPTLITKVLLGTLGCVPAYDRFFVDGIKMAGIKPAKYGLKSLKQLTDFYHKNETWLEAERKKFTIPTKNDQTLLYPQMKFLDMAFWRYGYDKGNNKA